MKNNIYSIALVLFLAILPLVLQIDFPQNDDWAYYKSVESYMQGNFLVNPITLVNKSAAIFYVQGLLALPFVYLFGLSRLPVLTLLISIGNFLLLYFLIQKYFYRSHYESVLISLLFFFNPLHFYSILGFMTENYFLFFALLGMYYLLAFHHTTNVKHFLFSNIFFTLGFLIRQFSLFFLFAHALYLLVNKKYKIGLIQLIYTLLIYAIYSKLLLFDTTLNNNGLNLDHLFRLKYTLTLIFAVGLYCISYFFPIIFMVISNTKFNISFPIIFIIVFVIISIIFPTNLLHSGEFPYFGNTVERQGFYIRDLTGLKSNFRGMYDLYVWWNVLINLLLFLIPVVIVVRFKYLIKDYFFIFLVVFTPVLVIALKMYDRYLLIFFLAFLFMFLNQLKGLTISKISFVFLVANIFFFILMDYQFGYDFVLSKKYVWHKAMTLDAPHSAIIAGNAWKKLHGQDSLTKYIFTYERPHDLKNDKLELIEIYNINFPGSLYVNNFVFLYKDKTYVDNVLP